MLLDVTCHSLVPRREACNHIVLSQCHKGTGSYSLHRYIHTLSGDIVQDGFVRDGFVRHHPNGTDL